MISGWRWSMDNLRDAYYLVQLIAQQILVFLRDFVFHEFAWFAPVEEDFDSVKPKIRNLGPQQASSIADIVVLLAVCGLLVAFMILSANSPKDDASNCEITGRIEAIPMAFEDEATSFWSSRPTSSRLMRCHHPSCNSSVDSRNIVVVTRKVSSRPTVSKSSVSATRRLSPSRADRPDKLIKPRLSDHNVRSDQSHRPHTCIRTQTSRPVAQSTTPREWLVRRTRSGHIYGRYSL